MSILDTISRINNIYLKRFLVILFGVVWLCLAIIISFAEILKDVIVFAYYYTKEYYSKFTTAFTETISVLKDIW